jgi:transposase
MRGKADYQSQIYYPIDIEAWIAADHPLRAVKRRADEVLGSMKRDFDRAYAKVGRPSIPPEMLLKSLLLQALYSIRSERQLVDQIQMNLLYKWFIDLSLDATAWDASTFAKNRERFEKHGLLRKFFERVVAQAYVEEWASDEHFTVDGTLIESYASLKSVRPKESGVERVSEGSDDDDAGNPTVNFRGERRKNETHESVVDPEARLYKKSHGVAAKLCHAAHVLMENRHGLVVDVSVSEANGFAEREEALELVRRARQRHELEPRTLAADKGYAAGAFLVALEDDEGVIPLIPLPDVPIKGTSREARARRQARRRSKTKRFAVAQRVRKRIEEINGWTKVIGGMRRSRHLGRWKIYQQALVIHTAYNLLRLARLEALTQAA